MLELTDPNMLCGKHSRLSTNNFSQGGGATFSVSFSSFKIKYLTLSPGHLVVKPYGC